MEEKFIQILREVLQNEEVLIKEEDRFRDFENWDSISALSLIAMVDSEYGVVITASEFSTLVTVRDIFEFIKKRQGV